MLKIVDFTKNHIEQARAIAEANYARERKQLEVLPEHPQFPDFSSLAENGLGVAAFADEKMVGYLTCFGPFENAFESTAATGIWSPIFGNGVVTCEDKNVFAKMYQAAAKKWVERGVTSHAITFYAHDQAVQNQLYHLGFGLRCMDAIRLLDEIDVKPNLQFEISELEPSEFHRMFALSLLLDEHLSSSPMFMRRPAEPVEPDYALRFANLQISQGNRYFVAKNQGEIIAYIKICQDGENFVTEADDMMNICGAFCLPEYRGKSVAQQILNFIIQTLKSENYQLLGVDFESFNPTASGFWLKYFTAYTQSVVRRIDDRFINQ